MANQNKHDDGISPAIAAVTGAVIGAGVAVAAVAMQDEKNREKVKEVLSNVKDHAVGYVEDMQKQVEEKKGEVEEKLVEGKEKLSKVVSSAKDIKEAVLSA